MKDLSDLSQVVCAALAGERQHGRLLPLHTPLGPEVLLAEQQALRASAAHEFEAPVWSPVSPAQWQAALPRAAVHDIDAPHTAQEGERAGEHGC